MAVKDENLYYPTENLILKRPRKHYCVAVKSLHWQLRSLISAEKRNLVYFPGGPSNTFIQRLDTESRDCETVWTLEFSPRCLVQKNGWVCCGGEHGDFSAVRVRPLVEEPPADTEMSGSTESDVRHGSLNVEGGGIGASEESILAMVVRAARRSRENGRTAAVARSVKFAQERVNCITLWFPPTDGSAVPTAYKEPVAVLANNDMTVTLVSLSNFERNDDVEALDVITYSDYVNRAVISPDGNLLVAVLDDPYLYVHTRVDAAEKSSEGRRTYRDFQHPRHQWELCRKILLKSQQCGDATSTRGSFAASFSNTGLYLAIGTQYGTISIFDTRMFSDPDMDPLVTSFQSSRPVTSPGAVRDMAFCPGPYDLLAWSEDRGHVGIADVRSGFVSRQILDISSGSDFDSLVVLDRRTIDPRILDTRGDRDHRNERSDATLPSIARVSISRRPRDPVEDMELTPDETMVLEALQEDRRRREQRLLQRDMIRLAHIEAQRGRQVPSAAEIRNMSTEAIFQEPWFQRAVQRQELLDGSMAILSRRLRTSGLSTTTTEPRDRRERDRERVWRELRARADADEDEDDDGNDGGDGDLHSAVMNEDVRQPTPPSQSNTSGVSGRRTRPGGWADLELLYDISIDAMQEANRNNNTPGISRRERTPLIPFVSPSEWGEPVSRIRQSGLGDQAIYQTPPEPDNTSGLAWSDDGKILYVGAQEGVYEFHVNVVGRKFCPNISMR